jgi:hypothetical protein
MSDAWAILGIEPTDDERAIRRAYARMLKRTHPEDDPQGFQALREAYEEALAMAAHARWRDEQAADDEGDLADDGDGEANENPAVAVLTVSDAPDDDDRRAIPPLRSALAQAVEADDQPTAAALLDTLLHHPAIDDVFVQADTENWLADMLVQNMPQSDGLIAPVVGHFGWDGQSGGRSSWQVETLLARQDEIALIASWTAPRSDYRPAWDMLVAPPRRGRLLRLIDPAVGPYVRRILATVDLHPRIAIAFDEDSAGWWRKAFGWQTEIKAGFGRAIFWWIAALIVQFGFGGGDQAIAVSLAAGLLAAIGVASTIMGPAFDRLAETTGYVPSRRYRLAALAPAAGLVMIGCAVHAPWGYWGSLAALAAGLVAVFALALVTPRGLTVTHPASTARFVLWSLGYGMLKLIANMPGPTLFDLLIMLPVLLFAMIRTATPLQAWLEPMPPIARMGIFLLALAPLVLVGWIAVPVASNTSIAGWLIIDMGMLAAMIAFLIAVPAGASRVLVFAIGCLAMLATLILAGSQAGPAIPGDMGDFARPTIAVDAAARAMAVQPPELERLAQAEPDLAKEIDRSIKIAGGRQIIDDARWKEVLPWIDLSFRQHLMVAPDEDLRAVWETVFRRAHAVEASDPARCMAILAGTGPQAAADRAASDDEIALLWRVLSARPPLLLPAEPPGLEGYQDGLADQIANILSLDRRDVRAALVDPAQPLACHVRVAAIGLMLADQSPGSYAMLRRLSRVH